MNLDLEQRLIQEEISFERLDKSEKVRILGRWNRTFPQLLASARHSESHQAVLSDGDADMAYERLPVSDFYILPDDSSAMPAYLCYEAEPPDLTALVSDLFTKCDELVVIARDFSWSAVFVNHGPSPPGRYFLLKLDFDLRDSRQSET